MRALLRFCSFDLYGCIPADLVTREPPVESGKLGVGVTTAGGGREGATRAWMFLEPRDRTRPIARRIGLVFGDSTPPLHPPSRETQSYANFSRKSRGMLPNWTSAQLWP